MPPCALVASVEMADDEAECVDYATAIRAFEEPATTAVEAEPETASGPRAAILGLAPGDAAERLMAAPIETLGVVELAERLALAISRRRGAAESGPVLPAAAATSPAAAATSEADFAQRFAVPRAFAPPADAPVEQEPSPISAGPLTVPPSLPVAPAYFHSAMATTKPSTVPLSMRPLHFDELDDDSLDTVLPPRRFGKPAQPVPVMAEQSASLRSEPPMPDPAPLTGESAVTAAATPDGADEESFGSLLSMKPSLREVFVRVDEPVDDQAPVEPVVVFPGQSGQTAPIYGDAGLRRFDSPDTLAAGKVPAAAVHPEETERALKAALATLQRMSGAA